MARGAIGAESAEAISVTTGGPAASTRSHTSGGSCWIARMDDDRRSARGAAGRGAPALVGRTRDAARRGRGVIARRPAASVAVVDATRPGARDGCGACGVPAWLPAVAPDGAGAGGA